MNDPSASRAQQIARAVIGSLAIALTLVGQLTLLATPENLGRGVILIAAGLVLFVWLAIQPPPHWAATLVTGFSFSYKPLLLLVATALAITATAVDVAFEQAGRVNYLPVLVLWASGAATGLAAFAIGHPGLGKWREWFLAHRAELAGIALVTLFAGVLRFYELGAIPRVINGDEGLMGVVALATREGGLANPFVFYDNFGGLYFQAIALALAIFGRTQFALRLLPALGGVLAIPALYLLARRLFGVRVAFLAALLLAISHFHIQFSRTVAVGYIQGTLLVPLELYFLISGLEHRSALRMALGGMLLGLHFCIYLDAQVVGVFILVYILIAAWLCRPLIQNAARVVPAFWFGALLIALPEIVYAWRYPNDFVARLNTDGTLQSGWLAAEMTRTGQSALQILSGRVAHVFLSLNYYPAEDFYGARIPVLDFITAVLFLLGLGYALWQTAKYRYLLLNTYFWSVTLAIGIFSIPPSADSYRMLIALPAVVLLAAVGLERLLVIFSLVESRYRIARAGGLAFLLAAVLSLNLRAYFVDFAPACRYESPPARFAWYLGRYLRTLNPETTALMLGDQGFPYGMSKALEFLSPRASVKNVLEPATSIDASANLAVIAIPARANELRAWASTYPGGVVQAEYDCDQLILLTYRLP